jgi:hypothetical protein
MTPPDAPPAVAGSFSSRLSILKYFLVGRPRAKKSGNPQGGTTQQKRRGPVTKGSRQIPFPALGYWNSARLVPPK